MSTPTEQPYAGYLVEIVAALLEIEGEYTQTADLLRDWLWEARAEINCGRLTAHTDTVLDIARDINAKRWAA